MDLNNSFQCENSLADARGNGIIIFNFWVAIIRTCFQPQLPTYGNINILLFIEVAGVNLLWIQL